jgi:hypothetical protein
MLAIVACKNGFKRGPRGKEVAERTRGVRWFSSKSE